MALERPFSSFWRRAHLHIPLSYTSFPPRSKTFLIMIFSSSQNLSPGGTQYARYVSSLSRISQPSHVPSQTSDLIRDQNELNINDIAANNSTSLPLCTTGWQHSIADESCPSRSVHLDNTEHMELRSNSINCNGLFLAAISMASLSL